jgi:hypothetical protein
LKKVSDEYEQEQLTIVSHQVAPATIDTPLALAEPPEPDQSDDNHTSVFDLDEGLQALTISDGPDIELLEAAGSVDGVSMSFSFTSKTFTHLHLDIIADDLGTAELYQRLRKIVQSPPDTGLVYQRIKKDLFHAFHMIVTPINHGMRPAFLRTMRDHLLRWDPTVRQRVDLVCRRVFKLTFDEMLARNPRWVAERCPRYVPEPSILTQALSLVFETFGNSIDAKTGAPLFNKTAWQKATSVLELAKEGYLSDPLGVQLYETGNSDKYGLVKYLCNRGTNKVEGGPHGDIYRKFGGLGGTELCSLYPSDTEIL